MIYVYGDHFANFSLNCVTCCENRDFISENRELLFRHVLISRDRIHYNFEMRAEIATICNPDLSTLLISTSRIVYMPVGTTRPIDVAGRHGGSRPASGASREGSPASSEAESHAAPHC